MSDLDRYAGAIQTLQTLGLEGIEAEIYLDEHPAAIALGAISLATMRCEHGRAIAEDCNDCEPLIPCDPPPIPFTDLGGYKLL